MSSLLWVGSCTSELQLKVNCRLKVDCRKKIWAGQPTVGQASPNFILQFTFSCNSLLHDLGLNSEQNDKINHKAGKFHTICLMCF